MKSHWKYLKTLLTHKWFVFRACRMTGVSLLRGLVHDWDKFLPFEFFAYSRNFFNPDGSKRNVRDETGYYDAARIGGEFAEAWLNHQHRNKHHWQHWVQVKDDATSVALPMPITHVNEMIADWMGAGRAYQPDGWTPLATADWYEAHRERMLLHPETKKAVEQWIAFLRVTYRKPEPPAGDADEVV